MGGRTRLRNGDLDAVVDRPVPDLPPVHRMPEQPAKLAGGEGVRIPLRLAVWAKDTPEEPLLVLRPRPGMVTAGNPGRPFASLANRTGGKIRCLELVEAGLLHL